MTAMSASILEGYVFRRWSIEECRSLVARLTVRRSINERSFSAISLLNEDESFELVGRQLAGMFKTVRPCLCVYYEAATRTGDFMISWL